MRLEHPFCFPLTIVAIAGSLVGCDGSDSSNDRATTAASLDRATVAASLQHYFSTFNPEDALFPTGSGPPRVKDNGCEHQHPKDFPLPADPHSPKRGGETVAFWQCPVRFESFTVPVAVAVNGNREVVWAAPVYGDSRNAPPLSPARTYTG